jgi:putative DNA primase/helicase
MRDAIEQFRDQILSAGLIPPDMIEADGKLYRFASNGKRGDDAGWYVLHGDGIPAGVFGDWRNGFSQTWRANIGRTLTPGEEAAHRAKVEAMRREREAEEERGHADAARKAAMILQAAQPAPDDYPYLTRKGIKAHGAKVHDGLLVLPMRDASGKLWNVERIAPEKPSDGKDKKGLYRGRRTGCYFSIGNPKGAAAICIAEGFATGATIHEATGYPVAVAFNAGNLGPVAKAMREKFADLPLILCADDDSRTEGNPGLTKATEAARSVGALLAIPFFGRVSA